MSDSNVRPRDASSLVILRGTGADTEVLLGRREPRDRFMPDIYVFPGGRVDRSDATAPATSELDSTLLGKLHARTPRARALAFAALRETYEETGLALGDLVDGTLRPDLGKLEYVARAITPAGLPIRYHVRFFLARGEDFSGDIRGSGELLDLAFVPLAKVSELNVINVTELVLKQAALRAREGPAKGVARIFFRGGGEQPYVCYE